MMKFFKSTYTYEPGIDENGKSRFMKVDAKEENELMEKEGFIVDKTNEVYIKEEYGVLFSNIDKSTQTIEEFKESIINNSDIYDFQHMNRFKEVLKYMEQGYEFVIGPHAPVLDDTLEGPGLYCKNYFEKNA